MIKIRNSTIICALYFICLANVVTADNQKSNLQDQYTNAQFDPEFHVEIPIKTTVIYIPPIQQQYRAVQTVYPHVSNRFQKKIDAAMFVNKHRDQMLTKQAEKTGKQSHNSNQKTGENVQHKLQPIKQEQNMDNANQQGIDQEQTDPNIINMLKNSQNIDILKINKNNQGNQLKKQQQKVQETQFPRISFNANQHYKFTPSIQNQYDITKQIYRIETPSLNNKFNKKLSTDWFINKILKKKQIQQSQKQKLNPKHQIQAKKDQKIKAYAAKQDQKNITNAGVIEWKMNKQLQPTDIHRYDKQQNIPIIKGEQKNDANSLKPHQKVSDANIIKDNGISDSNLHVNTINNLPNAYKPKKQDLQRPEQNINGNLKQNFEIPQKVSEQSLQAKERQKNSLRRQNQVKEDKYEELWLTQEKYIFLILSIISLGVIVFGNKQRQRVNQQRRIKQQYQVIGAKELIESNQQLEDVDQIEQAVQQQEIEQIQLRVDRHRQTDLF